VKEEVLKPDHRSIAHTLNNLVLVLDAQGKSEEAAKYRRREAALKSEHAEPLKPPRKSKPN